MVRLASLVFLSSLSVSVYSSEHLKVHGFLAQGVIQAADSNFVNDDGDVSLELTEVGINAAYRLNSSLRVAGQGVYVNGGNRYPEGASIDYLFLDWQVVNNCDWNVKAQFGRNKNYHWLYSATRDVPHTRPSIVLPQSLYLDAFRDVVIGVDGLALLGRTSNRLGEWDINLSFGRSKISDQEKRNLLGDVQGRLNHDSDTQFSLYFRPSISQWQWGISLLDANFSYDSAELDRVVDGEVISQRLMVSALYQGEKWEISSEIMRERGRIQNILFTGFANDLTAEGGYVQARYFVSPSLTLLSRLDVYDRDRKDRRGNNIELIGPEVIPNYFGFMDTGTLGITWRFASEWQVQGEFHRVKGTARLAPIFAPNLAVNNQKYWNMWALQLTSWF